MDSLAVEGRALEMHKKCKILFVARGRAMSLGTSDEQLFFQGRHEEWSLYRGILGSKTLGVPTITLSITVDQ